MAEEQTKPVQSVLKPVRLSRGTLLAQDLERARRFYEEFLGLECVYYAPEAMLVRDRDPQGLRHRAAKPYWVMDVRRAHGEWKTNLLKHWGIDVASNAEVERLHDYALAHQERLGIKTIRKPHMQHGTYSFYLEDLDCNWWEVECRPPGEDNDAIFARDGQPVAA